MGENVIFTFPRGHRFEKKRKEILLTRLSTKRVYLVGKKHNTRKNDITLSFENDIVTGYCTTDIVTKTTIMLLILSEAHAEFVRQKRRTLLGISCEWSHGLDPQYRCST